jgi:hypothetical protein
VTFLNYDNHRIDEQEVPYGSAAEAPEIPERKGYRFVEWNRNFDEITSDIEVFAIFEKVDAALMPATRSHAFSVHVNANTIEIVNAPIGNTAVLLDAQGRVLQRIRLTGPSARFTVLNSGVYMLRVGKVTERVMVR